MHIYEFIFNTNPQTSSAPAINNGVAHASKVAPVVETSSMIRMFRPSSKLFAYEEQANAPATF